MAFDFIGSRIQRRFALLWAASRMVMLPAADLPRPVGWWTGDGTTEDLVGTNSAAIANDSSYAGAVFGKGFAFNGRSDVVTVADATSQHPTQITVACWVKFNELLTPGAGTPGLQYLIFKRRPINSGFEGYTLVKDRLTGADRFKLVIANGSKPTDQVVTAGTTIIETNRFYFVVGTADGSDARLYVNGMLEGMSVAPFLIHGGTKPLVFGSSEESYNGRFSGVLDEPQIFDRALSQEEIQALYEQSAVAAQLTASLKHGVCILSWPARFADRRVEVSTDLQDWGPLLGPVSRTGYTVSMLPPQNLTSDFFWLVEP